MTEEEEKQVRNIRVGQKIKFRPWRGVYEVLEKKDRGLVLAPVEILSHKCLFEWAELTEIEKIL